MTDRKQKRGQRIRVSLLMFVSESPQARPRRVQAEGPHIKTPRSLTLSIHFSFLLHLFVFFFSLPSPHNSIHPLRLLRDGDCCDKWKKETILGNDMSSLFSPPLHRLHTPLPFCQQTHKYSDYIKQQICLVPDRS